MDWDLWLHRCLKQSCDPSTDGTRSGSCTLKVEEFKWKINYRFLMGRAITFPTDVADSPPFKSFNTDEEESFRKKVLCSPTAGH